MDNGDGPGHRSLPEFPKALVIGTLIQNVKSPENVLGCRGKARREALACRASAVIASQVPTPRGLSRPRRATARWARSVLQTSARSAHVSTNTTIQSTLEDSRGYMAGLKPALAYSGHRETVMGRLTLIFLKEKSCLSTWKCHVCSLLKVFGRHQAITLKQGKVWKFRPTGFSEYHLLLWLID